MISDHRPHQLEDQRNEALLSWYHENAKAYPWRGATDPYLVLVSEVMLQQTQAGRVAGHFERFVARFPTVEDLGSASLRDVLEAWSGLGYNRRAANLLAAAKLIATEGWPSTVSAMMELPGVGPYTARALACFALGADEVPVDTNVRRVLSRWHGEPLNGKTLQETAERDRSDSATADWVQAVMDLGSSRCLPRSPRCGECPVTSWCAGPDVYVAPPGQARFEGSGRQLRGSLIRTLVAGSAPIAPLAAATGFSRLEVEDALADLMSEGLVELEGATYRLPEE